MKRKKKLTPDQIRKKKRDKKIIKILTIVSIILVLLNIGIIMFLAQFSKGEVISGSMEPTLNINDRVIMDKKKEPERFNMIVFYPPGNDKEKYVKRVIGLPGDSVEYRDNTLYINGRAYEEPYLSEGSEKVVDGELTLADIPGMPEGEERIPEDHFLVLGDNRSNSEDSRSIGFVERDRIDGVVLFRYAPFKDFGSVYETILFPTFFQNNDKLGIFSDY